MYLSIVESNFETVAAKNSDSAYQLRTALGFDHLYMA
jgi:hypothetical protein